MLAKSGYCPAGEGTCIYSRAPQEQRAAEGPPEGTRSTEAGGVTRSRRGKDWWLLPREVTVSFVPCGAGTLLSAWTPLGTLEL